jgi:predicted nuclease with TOPRIM domain
MANENSTLVHEGITYRKVNRKANVGEKVLAVRYCEGYEFEVGDVFTVLATWGESGGIDAKNSDRDFVEMRRDEYLVLEPIADSDELTELTESDVRNNPRQVIDMFASLALNNTKLVARLTLLEGEHQALGERVERIDEKRSYLANNVTHIVNGIDERIDRLSSANEQAITTVARNVETWAQEHENLKHELAKVNERTQPYQQLHDVMVETAKAINKAKRVRPLTAEERREL